MIKQNGSKTEYWEDGKLHRDDGPAVINTNGLSFWYKHGKIHRDGGPAVDWGDGDQTWYKNGVYHREDGPAIDWSKEKAWYINGVQATTGYPNSKTHLKLLIDYKYKLKYKNKVIEYSQDEEERKKLERLT